MAAGKRSTALVLALLICLLSAAASLAAPPMQTYTQPPLLPGEKSLLDNLALRARPLDMASYVNLRRPVSVDHSSNLTYVRCQDWGGGCMMYTTIHCADIINEWHAPYTPDLSWQYALRTWDDLYNAGLRADPGAEPPDLNMVFNPGVSSEGLCRSESDYLTRVPPDHPAIAAVKGDRMHWDPAPSAEARAEAPNYRFHISDPITPSVDALKTLLLTYGPVWAAGGWWWDGGHAMTVVGYDDSRQEFKVLDSGGDWRYTRGAFSMPYSKVTEYISSLRTVQPLPSERYQGRWAYSSRIRILGAWRGTWTVNIGAQGQVPQTVHRTYGRMTDRPYTYGERLEIDVPLPAYASQFWPPNSQAKWYLQVEDNDNDGKQGTVVEWTIARRYEDPNCLSIDHWKTEAYSYSKTAKVPDAIGDPEVSTPPSRNNKPPAEPSSQSGMVTIRLPEETTTVRLAPMARVMLKSRITLEAEGAGPDAEGKITLVGNLTSVAGHPLAGKTVQICELTPDPNVNKPDEWKKLADGVTDADGRFSVEVTLPAITARRQVLGAVYRSASGEAICSSKSLVREPSALQWRPVEEAVIKLIPELDGPMPPLAAPVIRREFVR